MTNNRVLWGTKKGAPNWQEEVMIETDDADTLELVRILAEKDGFDRFRVQILDGKAPDFIGAVTGRPPRAGR